MYKHLKGVSNAEIIINKSRFIGSASFVRNDLEAKSFVEQVRKKNSDATHNCFAYISDELGNALKFSDDGEPQGTAGMPILEVLRNKKIVQTAIVVTRYFGGIKLGVGGLVRAYTDCAVKTIDSGKIVVETPSVNFEVICDYNLYKPLELLVLSLENLITQNVEFSDCVKISLTSKTDDFESCCSKITELTNAKIQIKKISEGFFPFEDER